MFGCLNGRNSQRDRVYSSEGLAPTISTSHRSPFEVLKNSAAKSIGVSDEKMLITDNDDTRKLFESCQMKAKTVVNPIIDWTDDDVWNFIQSEKIQCVSCITADIKDLVV